MTEYRIYYTVTRAGYDSIEADTLEQAIEKWETDPLLQEGNDGLLEYDPYTEEYLENLTKEEKHG